MDEARLAAGERAPRELPLSIARGGGVPWRRKPSRHPSTTCPALKQQEQGEDNDAGAWLVKQCPSWSPAARLDGKGNVDALENEGKQGKTVSWSPTCRILTLKRASSSPCCTLFERAMSPIECCGEDLEEGGSPLAMPLCAVGPPPLGAASPALFGVGATGGLQRIAGGEQRRRAAQGQADVNGRELVLELVLNCGRVVHRAPERRDGRRPK